MKLHAIVLASIAAASFVAAPAAGSGADGCSVETSPAFSIAGAAYLAGAAVRGTDVYVNLFVESNGIDGLQKRDSRCVDGSTLPGDLCVQAFDSKTCALRALP